MNIAVCFLSRNLTTLIDFVADSFGPFYDTYVMIDDLEPSLIRANSVKQYKLLGMSSVVANMLGCRKSSLVNKAVSRYLYFTSFTVFIKFEIAN